MSCLGKIRRETDQTCLTRLRVAPDSAGAVARADRWPGVLGLIDPMLYQLSAEHARGIADVTPGTNTAAFSPSAVHTVQGFKARPGSLPGIVIGLRR